MHRDGIRPRPIDDHKPYLIYKDLEQAKRTADKERETQINDIEKDLYHIIEYYKRHKFHHIKDYPQSL